jgi:hypothetical protein
MSADLQHIHLNVAPARWLVLGGMCFSSFYAYRGPSAQLQAAVDHRQRMLQQLLLLAAFTLPGHGHGKRDEDSRAMEHLYNSY